MMYELTKRVSRRYDLQYYIVLIAHLVRLAFFLFLFPVKFTLKTRRFSKFFCRNLSPFLPFPCLLLLVSLTTDRKHVFLFRSIVVVGHRIIFRFRSLSRLLRVLSLSFSPPRSPFSFSRWRKKGWEFMREIQGIRCNESSRNHWIALSRDFKTMFYPRLTYPGFPFFVHGFSGRGAVGGRGKGSCGEGSDGRLVKGNNNFISLVFIPHNFLRAHVRSENWSCRIPKILWIIEPYTDCPIAAFVFGTEIVFAIHLRNIYRI